MSEEKVETRGRRRKRRVAERQEKNESEREKDEAHSSREINAE